VATVLVVFVRMKVHLIKKDRTARVLLDFFQNIAEHSITQYILT